MAVAGEIYERVTEMIRRNRRETQTWFGVVKIKHIDDTSELIRIELILTDRK